MRTIRIHDILKDRVLVSRESARLLEGPIGAMMSGPGDDGGGAQVVVDFAGVEGMAPSFLDEILSIFEALIGVGTDGNDRRLIVANPPTRLSLKFEGVARGHGMSARALPDGSWVLADAGPHPGDSDVSSGESGKS